MEYNRKFFINGTQVGLYIQTDTNVEGNIDRIRKRLGGEGVVRSCSDGASGTVRPPGAVCAATTFEARWVH